MKGILQISVVLSWYLGFGLTQVIPGLSPSKPNRLLRTCTMQSAGADNTDKQDVYDNQPANSMNGWCRSYEFVTPCLSQYLPLASQTDANDWYVNLVYNEEFANKTSKLICSKLKKYGNRMGCLLADIMKAEKCVSLLTYPVATHLHKTFEANLTQNVEDNTLRACLIPVTAARCLQQFFKSCNKSVRKLLMKYFMILSGNCLKIAKEHESKEHKQQDDSEEEKQNTTETTEFANQDIKATSLVASITPETSGDHVLSEPANKLSLGWNTNDENDGKHQLNNRVSDINDNSRQNLELHDIMHQSNKIVPTINPPTHAVVPIAVQNNNMQQTTPPVTIFKMKIIQTVVNSNADQDSEKKIQHTVRVETPSTNNDISVNIEHSSKNIDNVGSGLQSSVVPQENVHRLGMIPTAKQEPVDSSEEIPIRRVIAVMTPVPERELIRPNMEDEVKSILSVYDNATSLQKDFDNSQESDAEDVNMGPVTEVEYIEIESEEHEDIVPPGHSTATDISSEESSAEIKTTAESAKSTRPPFRISEQTTQKVTNVKSTKTRQQKGAGSGASQAECFNTLLLVLVTFTYTLLI